MLRCVIAYYKKKHKNEAHFYPNTIKIKQQSPGQFILWLKDKISTQFRKKYFSEQSSISKQLRSNTKKYEMKIRNKNVTK